MDAPAIVALVALAGAALWVAYQHGHTLGFWDGCDVEATRWKERLEHLRRERAVERDAGDKLVAHCARQRLRLRGTLREARRWKAVAKRLGWRRPSTKVPTADDTTAMIAGDDLKRGDTLAVGRDGRVYHWSTVVYGARPLDPVTAAPVDPGSVYPTMLILPPQESAEATEQMAAAARRILGAAFDAGAKGGGA